MATDFVAYAGDTQQIVVTVTDEAGAALDMTGCALVYVMCDAAGAELLRKTTADGEITIAGNVAAVAIDAGDTTALAGVYVYHEMQITDTLGNVSTLLAGTVTFVRTRITP